MIMSVNPEVCPVGSGTTIAGVMLDTFPAGSTSTRIACPTWTVLADAFIVAEGIIPVSSLETMSNASYISGTRPVIVFSAMINS